MTVTFRKARFDRSLVVGTWLVVGGATLPFGCAGRSDSNTGGTSGKPDGFVSHGDAQTYDGGKNGGTAGGMVSDGRSQGGTGGSAGTEPRGGFSGGGFSGGGFTGGGVSGSGLIPFDGSRVDGRLDGYHDGRSLTDGFQGGPDGAAIMTRDGRDGFAPDGFGPDGDSGDGDPGGDGTSWSDGAP